MSPGPRGSARYHKLTGITRGTRRAKAAVEAKDVPTVLMLLQMPPTLLAPRVARADHDNRNLALGELLAAVFPSRRKQCRPPKRQTKGKTNNSAKRVAVQWPVREAQVLPALPLSTAEVSHHVSHDAVRCTCTSARTPEKFFPSLLQYCSC